MFNLACNLMWKSAVFLLDIMLPTPDLNLGQFVPDIIFSTISLKSTCSMYNFNLDSFCIRSIEFVGNGQHFVWGNKCCASKISLLTTNNPDKYQIKCIRPWSLLLISIYQSPFCSHLKMTHMWGNSPGWASY